MFGGQTRILGSGAGVRGLSSANVFKYLSLVGFRPKRVSVIVVPRPFLE